MPSLVRCLVLKGKPVWGQRQACFAPRVRFEDAVCLRQPLIAVGVVGRANQSVYVRHSLIHRMRISEAGRRQLPRLRERRLRFNVLAIERE